MAALGISAVVASISLPQFETILGQMKASQDVRRLSSVMSEQRIEAIRLKTNVRFTFDATGYHWDIGDNGSIDGSQTLLKNSKWKDDAPADIVFNGLGVARGIGTEATIGIVNKKQALTFTINSNGYMSL